jgi:tetratricopeptide (TPR) repeat protein
MTSINGPSHNRRTTFVGRVREQQQFRDALDRLLDDHQRWRQRADELGRHFDPDAMPKDETYPRAIILHGIGGIGKTRLTRRFLDIAEGDSQPPALTCYTDVSLGWPILEPMDLMKRLHNLLVEKGFKAQLASYRDARNRAPEVRERVLRYKEQNRERWESIVSAVSGLAAKGAQAYATARGLPVDDASTEFAGTVLSETLHGGAAATAQAWDWLMERMQTEGELTNDEVQLFRDPAAAQAAKLVDGLLNVAVQRPLIIALDTLEVLVRLEPFLRDHLVLPTQHAPILWILSGRHNLAQERTVTLDAQRRIIKGYRDLLGNNPPLIWDVSTFGDADIRQYLADECQRLNLHLNIDEALVAALKATSGGVPLALELAVDALAKMERGAFLRDFALDDAALLPEERLRQVTERFLRYCLKENKNDLEKVQAMALLRRERQTDTRALRALWGLSEDLRIGNVLHALRSRYAFVRSEGLHDAVYDFVRRELRSSQERCEDRERLGERAVEHFRQQWAREHDVPGDPALKVRDPRWQAATRNYLNALLWIDPDAAVRFLVPRVVEGLGFERSFAGSLLEQAGEFAQAENTLSLRRVDADFIRRVQKDISPTAPVETDDDNPLAALERLIRESQGKSSTRPSIETLDLLLRRKSLLENLQRAILYLLRGRALAAEEEHEAALTAYLKAEEYLPKEAEDLGEQVGKAFYRLSDEFLWPKGATTSVRSEKGLEAAQAAVDLYDESGSAHYNLGTALQNFGRYDEALAAYQVAIQREPRATRYNGLGNVYAHLDRYADAEAAFRKAIDLDPEDAGPYNNLGLIYEKQEKYEEAANLYQQALERHTKPEDKAVFWRNLGDVYRTQGRYADAEAAYRRAIDFDPEYAWPWHEMAHLFALQGRPGEAVAAFNEAINRDSKTVKHWCCLGNTYLLFESFSDAKAAFQKALRIDAEASCAKYGLVLIQALREGDFQVLEDLPEDLDEHYKKQIQSIDRLLNLSHDQLDQILSMVNRFMPSLGSGEQHETSAGELYIGMGLMLEEQGDPEGAINAFEKALDLEPELDDAWLGLGNVYDDLGRYDEAETAYRKAIDLDPEYATPWNGLGNVYRAQGRYEDAEVTYLKVLELDPENPYAYNNLAGVYVALDKLDKAVEFFQKRISLSPDDALAAQVALGCINYAQDEISKAKEHFQAALDLWETAWQRRLQSPAGMLENKALALMGLGDKDKAIATLKEALSQMLPGDVIDFEYYDLLAQAPQPLEGLEEMRRQLEAASQEQE